jgi:hypothetical protein
MILELESKLWPFLGTQTISAGESLNVTEALPLWAPAEPVPCPCLKESSSQSMTLRFRQTEDFLRREGLITLF